MEIKVYGPGCSKCEETEGLVKQVVKDMNIAANVEKVSDFKEMMMQGIMSTPTVAIDGKIVCAGYVPGKEEIRNWLSDAGSMPASGTGSNCCCDKF